MAQAHQASPYTIPGDVEPYGVQDPYTGIAGLPSYAVPDPVDSARDSRHGWDNSGSSTPLRESPTGTPDASRLKHFPRAEKHPREQAAGPWYRRLYAEILGRHSVEYQDADGFEEQKGRKIAAPRPVPSDVPESRPTMRMSPHTYVFTRPIDTLTSPARELNGIHFSMADHRREYDVFGMRPARKVGRNTYRLEPEPWDANLVDMPEVVPMPYERVTPVNVPPAGNRSWRL